MKRFYSKTIGTIVLGSALFLGMSPESEAQIVTYDFTGAAGNEVSLPATTVDPNLTASPITRGADITPNAGGNSFNSTGWTTSTTLEPTKYVSVTLTPSPTFSLTLTQLTFDSQRSNSGPQTWAVRSSLDNFGADLATFQMVTGTNAYQDQVVNLTGVVTNVTNPVEFRIYAYNATTGGTFRVSDLKFYGSVNPAGPGTSLSFVGNANTVAENIGTTNVLVSIANPSATTASSVDVVVTGGTATNGTDYTYSTQTITFPAGSSTNLVVAIPVTDDAAIEPDETIILELQNPSAGIVLGTSTFTVTISDNDTPPPVIPLYTIASVTTNDANGVADSATVQMSLRGITHGVNNSTNGLQFTLIDNTGGINIFKSSGTLGYTYAEGDSLEVTGTLAQFNGLTQLVLTNVQQLTSGNTLFPATIVTSLNENTESELVKIANPVQLVDPSAWSTSGASFNVAVTDGTDTYQMRVNTTTNIFGQAAPVGQFYLTGIGGQFDGSIPHTEGYQIAPRYMTDIDMVASVADMNAETLTLYPNPATNYVVVNLGKTNSATTVQLINSLGQVVSSNTVAAGVASEKLDLGNLPAGMYFVKTTNAAKAKTGTVIKF